MKKAIHRGEKPVLKVF
uniref:Uncharacterized protein n=1 Tax=Anguilla anguilla TaxID=7936 RepID=A0A0E9VHY8_ANGAN